MTARHLVPLALLTALAFAGAQNNLFNTSTTAPKAAPSAQPIEIHASGAGTFDLNTGLATYRTNVRVNDPQFSLRSETLRLLLDVTSVKAVGQAKPPTPVPVPAPGALPLVGGPMNNRIREAEAVGGVIFSNKVDGTQAFANRVVYYATNDAFELTGDAKVVRGDFTSRAPKFMYYRARGVFESEGESLTTFTPTNTNNPVKKP